MNTSSRTSLRLQLMREQSLIDQHKGGSKESFGSLSPGSSADATTASSSPLAIRVSATNAVVGSSGSGGGGSVKTSPIIISQPIRFTGNRLVHLPPQIIHVQQQQQVAGDDIMGRRNLILSSSLPPGLPQNTPPKVSMTGRSQRVTTPQQYQIQHQPRQHRLSNVSKHSPSELSPSGGGNCESPQSASFTSAQSELDDIIIDEILSMEDEQRRCLDPDMANNKMPNSLSYANNLEGYMSGGRVPYSRQASSSAPTSTIDIEGLVREELTQEHEIMRDRRKKDIHNMIERRRRYNINDRIKELGTLLPKGCTEEMKLNKGTILKASVEYIRVLKRDQEKLHQILQRYQNIEQDNKLLMMRIQELEEHLKSHGVPVPPTDPSFASSSSNADGGPIMDRHLQTSFAFQRQIKSEPLEEEQTPQPTPQPTPNQPAPSFTNTNTNIQQEVPVSTPHQQHSSPAPTQTQDGREHVQQQQQQLPNRIDYNPAMIGGHSYAISDAQFSSFYSSAMAPFGSAPATVQGVLETPPVVNNNLTPFDQPRLATGHRQNQHQQQQQQHHQHLDDVSGVQQRHHQQFQELMMDLGDGAVMASTAALVSGADPLMSDSRLINSQVASPEIQWEAQSFSPESEQMDFAAP